MTIAPRHFIGTAAGLIIAALLLFRGPWAASAETDKPTASNTSLSCEQSQQAMVRHTIVRGELQVAMQCVGPATVSGVAAYDEGAVTSSNRFGAMLSKANVLMADGTNKVVFVAGTLDGWLFWDTNNSLTSPEAAIRLQGLNDIGAFGHGDLM